MARSVNKSNPLLLFRQSALVLLLAGLIFGLTGALQYLLPEFLRDQIPFLKIRPLHVSAVVFWILFAAVSVVYTYITETGNSLHKSKGVRLHYYLWLFSIACIFISYLSGNFGGREYWEFPAWIAIPVIAGWVVFVVKVVRSSENFIAKPVYVWMWLTGAIFFLFTFIESYLWVLPFFNRTQLQDMTIQWKSYGSMVGSWNMLIYGSSFYLMEKISGSNAYSTSRIAFLLYFLGFFNLMYNWGHHIYTLPVKPYVHYVSYVVSMTELLIIGKILFTWRKSLTPEKKLLHLEAYRLLFAADIWVLLTLLLAICMSVPAINVYTHGTHVTVAHTMGATIGINSMLLLAMLYDIILKKKHHRSFNAGFLLLNFSLLVFWIALIGAGIQKSIWAMQEVQIPFGRMMQQSRPWFILFFSGGTGVAAGFALLVMPLLRGMKQSTTKSIANREEEVLLES